MFKNNLILYFIIFFSLVLGIFLFSNIVLAEKKLPNLTNTVGSLENVGEVIHGKDINQQDSDSFYLVIGRWVNFFVSLVGVVLALFIIYGGFLWMLAGGNDEQVTKAKGILKNSIIAAAIILLAWAITSVILYFFGLRPSGY